LRLAVDLEAQPEVRAAGHDDGDVDPDLHRAPRHLDAAVVLAGLARGDVVAVRGLQRLARRVGPSALAGRGARGVLGVVGHGQGQVHLPHDEPEEQDRGQHEQQLDARLPAL